jgi:hypothetical protein
MERYRTVPDALDRMEKMLLQYHREYGWKDWKEAVDAYYACDRTEALLRSLCRTSQCMQCICVVVMVASSMGIGGCIRYQSYGLALLLFMWVSVLILAENLRHIEYKRLRHLRNLAAEVQVRAGNQALLLAPRECGSMKLPEICAMRQKEDKD